MGVLTTIIIFLAVLGPMIFIHEFGHFAVAKLLKINVEVFSLGFGPRLFGFRFGETDYRVCAIPLGGYVKMKGENLDEELEGTGDEFLSRPKWHRLLVLFAGPVMNIVTAIAIPAIIAMFFLQVPAYLNQPAVIGSIALESAAAQAGLQPGDHIVRFAKIQNPTWGQVKDYESLNPGQPVPVTVIRNGQEVPATLTPSTRNIGHEKIGDAGFFPSDWKQSSFQVQSIQPASPAAAAGLQPNDTIVGLNGQPVIHFFWFKDSLKNFDGREINLEVERNGQRQTLKVTPRRDPVDGDVRVGFIPAPMPTIIPLTTEHKSVIEAVQFAVSENWRYLVLTKEAFAQIFSGQRNVKDALAGPIGIAQISTQAYQSGGIERVLQLMGVLSLNLGVFNLLPIPVLDGGHIFIIFLEALFGLIGWQITTGVKEKLMQTGFVLLVLLMGFVIYNDISRTFGDRKGTQIPDPPKAQSKPEPTPAPSTAPSPSPAGQK